MLVVNIAKNYFLISCQQHYFNFAPEMIFAVSKYFGVNYIFCLYLFDFFESILFQTKKNCNEMLDKINCLYSKITLKYWRNTTFHFKITYRSWKIYDLNKKIKNYNQKIVTFLTWNVWTNFLNIQIFLRIII